MVKVLFTDNKITKSEVRKVNTKHNYIYIFVNYFFLALLRPLQFRLLNFISDFFQTSLQF